MTLISKTQRLYLSLTLITTVVFVITYFGYITGNKATPDDATLSSDSGGNATRQFRSVSITSPTYDFITDFTTNNISCMEKKDCPNIVYLLADDLGYGDVGYNGGIAHTPNLNDMASGQHSILFSRFYSGGPTCSPTRGTLLTGRNHNRYCIWHADLGNPKRDLTCPSSMPLPSSELTVAEILRDVGYHTSVYGKWHVGDLKRIQGGNSKWPVSNPSTHGFSDWLVTERHTSNLLPNCKCSDRFHCTVNGSQYETARCRNYWYMNPLTNTLTTYNGAVIEDSHFLIDRFEEFLHHRNVSKPFYFQLSFHSVHSQYLATPYWKQYYAHITDRDKKHYLGAISALDEAIGRVRALLKEYNISDNTLLWFSSDNGPQTGEPGSTGGLRGRKGSVWEGGIRVPGIIEWPRVITSNRKSSVPVVTTDFLPTVADVVGYEIPPHITLDGTSILPLLQNKANRRGHNIKFAFHIKLGRPESHFDAAVVGDRFKYLAELSDTKIERFYLFDLDNDSSETRNVSSSHSELTVSMRTELEQFLSSVHESAAHIGCLHTHDRRHLKICRNS